MLPRILIISASVREGRKSHHVALYFERFLNSGKLATVSIADLKEYKFPIFSERLKNLENPPAGATAFAQQVKDADGVIIVTPEYNGGYPASLKNAIDLLYDEWHRKPVAIATVSSGAFGGSQVITSLQFSLWKIRAWTVPAMFPVAMVEKSFDAQGNAHDEEKTAERAKKFIDELLWCVEAHGKMSQPSK